MNDIDLSNWSAYLSKFHGLAGLIEDLKSTIDQLNSSFEDAKRLILELARKLDEGQLCGRDQISRAIKDILKDKVRQGYITARWIEECLPVEYKRIYIKSEGNSLSKGTKKKMLIFNGEKNSHARMVSTDGLLRKDHEDNKSERKCPRCLELEEVISKTSQIHTAGKIAERELRIPIPMNKYEELKSVIDQGNGSCTLS